MIKIGTKTISFVIFIIFIMGAFSPAFGSNDFEQSDNVNTTRDERISVTSNDLFTWEFIQTIFKTIWFIIEKSAFDLPSQKLIDLDSTQIQKSDDCNDEDNIDFYDLGDDCGGSTNSENSYDTFGLELPTDESMDQSINTLDNEVYSFEIRETNNENNEISLLNENNDNPDNNNIIPPIPRGSPSDPWWDTGWDYRKEITIDSSKVTATLSDFPVLISLDDSNLASLAQANGEDIVFTAHEIDYYSGGTLQAWVNVTSLSDSTDTVLYMYFGNATCPSQENPSGVWDNGFVMVQHMQETSGTHYDSTGNNNDATEYVTPDSNMDTSGIIAGSDWFDGIDDNLEVSSDLVTGDGTTVSFWEYNMTIGTGYGRVLSDFSAGGFLWQFGNNPTDFQVGNVGDWGNNLVYAHGGLVDDTWHYYTVTLTSGTITLYEDGSPVSSKSHTTTVSADGAPVRIMGESGQKANGKMDELRVSSTARSADWIQTSYNNQYEPDSFFDVGALEPPLPWWNDEWQYRRKITIDNTKVAGDLTDFPTLIQK